MTYTRETVEAMKTAVLRQVQRWECEAQIEAELGRQYMFNSILSDGAMMADDDGRITDEQAVMLLDMLKVEEKP